ELRAYIVGPYLLEYFGDKMSRFLIHGRGHDNTGILIRMQDIMIYEMELVPISDADIPKELGDPEAIKREMARVDQMNIQEQKEFYERETEKGRREALEKKKE